MTMMEARKYADEHGVSVRTAFRKAAENSPKKPKGVHHVKRTADANAYEYSTGEWV